MPETETPVAEGTQPQRPTGYERARHKVRLTQGFLDAAERELGIAANGKRGFQTRIDKLTQTIHALRRENAALVEQVETLKLAIHEIERRIKTQPLTPAFNYSRFHGSR